MMLYYACLTPDIFCLRLLSAVLQVAERTGFTLLLPHTDSLNQGSPGQRFCSKRAKWVVGVSRSIWPDFQKLDSLVLQYGLDSSDRVGYREG